MRFPQYNVPNRRSAFFIDQTINPHINRALVPELGFPVFNRCTIQITQRSAMIAFQIEFIMIGNNALIDYMNMVIDHSLRGCHAPVRLLDLGAHRPRRP